MAVLLLIVGVLILRAPGAARPPAGDPPPPSAAVVHLRNLGIAWLENEKPAEAEAIFRQLAELMPQDPLAFANLAIALLRQQKIDEALQWIDRALVKAPGESTPAHGALYAIRGDVLLVQGEVDPALADFRRAATAAPYDVEILYALYRHARTFAARSEAARQALPVALEQLGRLRPENLVVLLERLRRAIASDDRSTSSAAYLRLRELLWQAPGAAENLLDRIRVALETGELAAARVPALQLSNVLKSTPMFQGSQRELWTDILGLPVLRFIAEPPPSSFGDPVPVRFDGQALSPEPGVARALVTADFDGDQRPDIARLVASPSSGPASLEVRLARDGFEPARYPAPADLSGLLAADLSNRGSLDLIGFGPRGAVLWRGSGDGRFELVEGEKGLPRLTGIAATVLDYDIEGDLDLALAGTASLALVRNASGRLEAVGPEALPRLTLRGITDLVASDLDRDGDLDLLLAEAGELLWLDNLRQGRFRDRTAEAGLDSVRGTLAVVSADLDADGLSDLVTAGAGLAFLHNNGGTFEPWGLEVEVSEDERLEVLLAFDADNDGRLDLGATGPGGVVLLSQRPEGGFARMAARALPEKVTALAPADLDDDGDLDLVASGDDGLHWLKNRGGHRNGSLVVRLRGLVEGNSKNNLNGIGATLELWAGTAYQFREITEPVTHLGLGDVERADLLRIVWTNGVPENRFDPESNQSLVEEQKLKGSCPFLYAWDGDGFRFVTDLLWGAPIGMPVAPGVWAQPDPVELVAVEGLVPRDGSYHLRVTEELWEAAFFDFLRLWVVDHPLEVEVASSLRIMPGREVGERVLASRNLRPPAVAWDGRGDDVTQRVLERDEIFADGYERSAYQGVAAKPWTFTFDLGVAPAGPVRLHLDGWIFPADASLNLAVAQREDLELVAPRLEMEDGGMWRELVPSLGFPAGKTKTMVVDTPALPPGVRRLRIVTSQWLAWDRIAWSTDPAPELVEIQAELVPTQAELRFRGFSALVRNAPNGPHRFDYQRVSQPSPWSPLPGCYTRYGDVRELLASSDDRSVILAAGDELMLVFDANHLAPPPAGWRRTLFLESHGWDKDADRNTFEGHRLDPLPFRAMSGYPWGEDESFPDTPEMRQYRQEWLTRAVGDRSGASPSCP